MTIAVQHELLHPMGNLARLDPGAMLIEIEYPYDDAFGDPAIHYFQVIERSGRLVTIAGIAKELIPGTEREPDFRKRVRPIKGAVVRGCAVCRGAALVNAAQPDEPWPSFQAISDARWYAYDGTGPSHDETSPDFQHAFADYIPTATLPVFFVEGEPYLNPGPPGRTLLSVVNAPPALYAPAMSSERA